MCLRKLSKKINGDFIIFFQGALGPHPVPLPPAAGEGTHRTIAEVRASKLPPKYNGEGQGEGQNIKINYDLNETTKLLYTIAI